MDNKMDNARHWQYKYIAKEARHDIIWNSALDSLVQQFGAPHNPRCDGRMCQSCFVATMVDSVRKKIDGGNYKTIVERLSDKSEEFMTKTNLRGKERAAFEQGMAAIIGSAIDIIGDLK